MSMITKEEIAEVVYQPDFDFDDFVGLISNFIEMDFPDELRDPGRKEELIELCFLNLKKKYESEDQKDVEEEVKHPVIKINLNKDSIQDDEHITQLEEEPKKVQQTNQAFTSRKSQIIYLCQQNKYTVKQIIQIIDDDWGYSIKGKTSNTRVNKTLNELKDTDLVRVNSDNLVLWNGE